MAEKIRNKNGRFIPLTTSAKIRKLARQGRSNSAIAKQLDVSFHHVYSVVRSAKSRGLI